MSAYQDTYQKIIDTLMGRPAGTEIQPDKHQDYALSLLEYVRSLEIAAQSTLIGVATSTTVPVQPDGSSVSYIATVNPNTTTVFSNFVGSEGQYMTVTTQPNQTAFSILLWNGEYWDITTTYVNFTIVEQGIGETPIGNLIMVLSETLIGDSTLSAQAVKDSTIQVLFKEPGNAPLPAFVRNEDKIYIPVPAKPSTNFNPYTYDGFVSFFIGNTVDKAGTTPTVPFGEEKLFYRVPTLSSVGKPEEDWIEGIDVWTMLIYLSTNGVMAGNTPALLKDVWGKQVIATYAPGWTRGNTLVGVTRAQGSIIPETEVPEVVNFDSVASPYVIEDSTSRNLLLVTQTTVLPVVEFPLGLTIDKAMTLQLREGSGAIIFRKQITGLPDEDTQYTSGDVINAFFDVISDTWTITKVSNEQITDYSNIKTRLTSNANVVFSTDLGGGWYYSYNNAINGVPLVAGNIVFLKNQTNPLEIGVYETGYITILARWVYHRIANGDILKNIQTAEGTNSGVWQSIWDGVGTDYAFERLSTKAEKQYVDDQIAAIPKAYIPKGNLSADFDYTTIVGLQIGWTYHIAVDALKDINFPLVTYPINSEIYWTGTQWESLGVITDITGKIDKVTGNAGLPVKLNAQGNLEALTFDNFKGEMKLHWLIHDEVQSMNRIRDFDNSYGIDLYADHLSITNANLFEVINLTQNEVRINSSQGEDFIISERGIADGYNRIKNPITGNDFIEAGTWASGTGNYFKNGQGNNLLSAETWGTSNEFQIHKLQTPRDYDFVGAEEHVTNRRNFINSPWGNDWIISEEWDNTGNGRLNRFCYPSGDNAIQLYSNGNVANATSLVISNQNGDESIKLAYYENRFQGPTGGNDWLSATKYPTWATNRFYDTEGNDFIEAYRDISGSRHRVIYNIWGNEFIRSGGNDSVASNEIKNTWGDNAISLDNNRHVFYNPGAGNEVIILEQNQINFLDPNGNDFLRTAIVGFHLETTMYRDSNPILVADGNVLELRDGQPNSGTALYRAGVSNGKREIFATGETPWIENDNGIFKIFSNRATGIYPYKNILLYSDDYESKLNSPDGYKIVSSYNDGTYGINYFYYGNSNREFISAGDEPDGKIKNFYGTVVLAVSPGGTQLSRPNGTNPTGILTITLDNSGIKFNNIPTVTTNIDKVYVKGTDGYMKEVAVSTIVPTPTAPFFQNIGNGVDTVITVTHNLGTKDVTHTIKEITTDEFVYTTVTAPTVNTIVLTFAVAPTTNQYRVKVTV